MPRSILISRKKAPFQERWNPVNSRCAGQVRSTHQRRAIMNLLFMQAMPFGYGLTITTHHLLMHGLNLEKTQNIKVASIWFRVGLTL